ncbi:MAG: twin-arginine translocase subunit TatB [Deltaproteobacteria bacterium]|nr:twin-arginine translocase subunit TatB [Deltaproteobacteria bacterium]
MSGIGWTEFLVIALILLIFVGPQRLPELFRKIAWVIAQLRSASQDLRHQIDDELAEIRQVKADFTTEMKAQTDKLYAEARAMDDEYKSLQDDVNDVKTALKTDLDETQKDATNALAKGENRGEQRELKG